MTKMSENQSPKLTFLESAAPSTPSSGLGVLYEQTDGNLYFKNDAGTESQITGGASGIAATIFDAKGDIIAATAADTASRLAVGNNGSVLTAASAQSTGLAWGGPGCYENFLAAPVTVVNVDTWYASAALTPLAGTYLFIAKIVMSSSFSGTTSCTGAIGVGSPPTYANGQAYVPAATQVVTIPVFAVITVNGSETVTAYGLSARGSSVVSILDVTTSGAITDKATSLHAIRITSL